MQRFNLTAEQLYSYNTLIQIEQPTCPRAAAEPVAKYNKSPAHQRRCSAKSAPAAPAYTSQQTQLKQQQQQITEQQSTEQQQQLQIPLEVPLTPVLISSEDDLPSNSAANEFFGFKQAAPSTPSSFCSSRNDSDHKFRLAQNARLRQINIQQQALKKQLGEGGDCRNHRLEGGADVEERRGESNAKVPRLEPQPLETPLLAALNTNDIYEINSNSTTTSEQLKRAERNEWLKEQLIKQEQLRELQTAKIREFNELREKLNQRSTTNRSSDSTITEFPASSPSNPQPYNSSQKYTPRSGTLLKNTLPADAFERSLAIISASNSQISYTDKVHQWQSNFNLADLSDVEDVRDFELRFHEGELSREQQRKARKRRRNSNKTAVDLASMPPSYTLDEFLDMLRDLCRKKIATTPFTANEHKQRQSRLHKRDLALGDLAAEHSDGSESTLTDEQPQHCSRRTKRKPSGANQRRTRRSRSSSVLPTERIEASQGIEHFTNIANNLPATNAVGVTQDAANPSQQQQQQKFQLTAEEKSLFRYYKHHFADDEQEAKSTQAKLTQQQGLKAVEATPLTTAEPQPLRHDSKQMSDFCQTVVQLSSLPPMNDLPAKLLSTPTPTTSQSISGRSSNADGMLLSTPVPNGGNATTIHNHNNNNNLSLNNNIHHTNNSNSNSNHLPTTSSNESRRSLPADFGVMQHHRQQEFCSYLGLTGLGMSTTLPIVRSNSALTRRSLRVRMQQKIPTPQELTLNSLAKVGQSAQQQQQQSLDGSNLYMTPANSQQSPFPSSEQQSDVMQYLQPNSASKRHEQQRQSLDYSNYTSESPKNSSQNPEEYRMDNYDERLKSAYTEEELRLAGGRDEILQMARISPSIEPCKPVNSDQLKCTPIVQYKPNTKPEIKIICSIAATTKEEVLQEGCDEVKDKKNLKNSLAKEQVNQLEEQSNENRLKPEKLEEPGKIVSEETNKDSADLKEMSSQSQIFLNSTKLGEEPLKTKSNTILNSAKLEIKPAKPKTSLNIPKLEEGPPKKKSNTNLNIATLEGDLLKTKSNTILDGAGLEVKPSKSESKTNLDSVKLDIKPSKSKTILNSTALLGELMKTKSNTILVNANSEVKPSKSISKTSLGSTKLEEKLSTSKSKSSLDSTKLEEKLSTSKSKTTLDSAKLVEQPRVSKSKTSLDNMKMEEKLSTPKSQTSLGSTKLVEQTKVSKSKTNLDISIDTNLMETPSISKTTTSLNSTKLPQQPSTSKSKTSLNSAKLAEQLSISKTKTSLSSTKTSLNNSESEQKSQSKVNLNNFDFVKKWQDLPCREQTLLQPTNNKEISVLPGFTHQLNSNLSSSKAADSPTTTSTTNKVEQLQPLPKMTPEAAYQKFQTYLLESRKHKPSICIVQTLPGAGQASAGQALAGQASAGQASTGQASTGQASAEPPTPAESPEETNANKIDDEEEDIRPATSAVESLPESKGKELATSSKSKPKKNKKANKPAVVFLGSINKLVTRSSRRGMRPHSNRGKIIFRPLAPKPKRKPKAKSSTAGTPTPSNKVSNTETESLRDTLSEQPSCRQTPFTPITEETEESIDSSRPISASSSTELFSNQQLRAMLSGMQTDTLNTKQMASQTAPINWLKRRRKSARDEPVSIIESSLTTTIIKTGDRVDDDDKNRTIISINPIVLKSVETTDSQVQTIPTITKDQAVQCTSPVKQQRGGLHYLSTPSVIFENPLSTYESYGEVLYIYYELDVLIVVQEQLISFWKYSKIANILAQSPTRSGQNKQQESHEKRSEWSLLGKLRRIMSDVEIKSSYANRICVHNSIPLYLELRCRELPRGQRECKLLTTYINVYYFHDEDMVCRLHSIPLDTVQGEPTKLLFTTLVDSRYFIMCWSHENSLGKTITGFCKYSLTPNLDTLASIRGFKNLAHELTYLECINEDKLIGFGRTQVTIWDHRSGDVLMNYDLNMPLGINMGCTYYPSFDMDNMIVLYQCVSDEYSECCEFQIIAVDVSAMTPSHRIIHRHQLPAGMLLRTFKNTINNGEQLIVTAMDESEIWISCADPTTLTYVPAQRSRRYYARSRNQVIELTDKTLNVLAFTDYLLNLQVVNSC